ncbi:MAG: sugar phosphate isomerase/epimerase family protein [Acetivibrionales bacterium]
MVKEVGFDGMSIEFGNYADGYPVSVREVQDAYLDAQQKYEIEYPNIGMSGFDYLPFHAHKGTAMHEVVKQSLRLAIDAAAYMKIPLVFIPTFGVSTIETEDQFKNAVHMFQYAADYAEKKHIMIASESVMDLPRQIRLYEEVRRGNFRLFYDSDNFFYEKGYDQVEMLKGMYPYMVDQLHVKDGKAGVLAGSLLGDGDSDFAGTIAFLKEKGFKGWIISENLYFKPPLFEIGGDALKALREDVQRLKKL